MPANDTPPQAGARVERGAFEAWAKRNDVGLDLDTWRGEYESFLTESAWVAWQAARSRPGEVIVREDDEHAMEEVAKALYVRASAPHATLEDWDRENTTHRAYWSTMARVAITALREAAR